jgi:hypothetical protein
MRRHNSTIKVKEKICVSCGKPCYWFSKKRCQSCAKIEDVRDAEEKEAVEDLGSLIDELDDIFSRYIRMRSAGPNDISECYTCEIKSRWQELDLGHYVSRKCMFLRWDERNCKPQCQHCNRVKYGNLALFGQRLELNFPGITEILLEESRIVHKWSRHELEAMIANYKQQIKLLKQ